MKKQSHVYGIAHVAMNSVSKSALIDLVADLLRRIEGDESLDGDELAIAFFDAYEPIGIMRGDRRRTIDQARNRIAKMKAWREKQNAIAIAYALSQRPSAKVDAP